MALITIENRVILARKPGKTCTHIPWPRNAVGFLLTICSLAFIIKSSFAGVFQQGEQSHLDEHFLLLAKHSQYSFRHFDFLQFQGLKSATSSSGMVS
jgi:hypothetical protein